MSSKPLKAHPLADLLPPMSDADYAALKADIAANGQRDPIVMLDGMALDGRHRDRVCVELKRLRKTRKFDPRTDGTPLAFVCSKAIHRNLDKTQKACAAARIEPELAKEAEQRMKAGGKVNGEGLARDHAARIFGISGTYVGMAKTILSRNPKLFQQCFDGKETLSRAAAHLRRHERSKKLSRLASANTASIPQTGWKIERADSTTYLVGRDVESQLIVADPPYNIGIDYGDGEKGDSLPADKYVRFIGNWIGACARQLVRDGTFVIIINDEWAAEHMIAAKSAGLHLRNWIKWYETFGTNCANKFNRTSRHLLYFTKHPSLFTFHPEIFTRPSARQIVYGDKRAATHGKLWDDVWIIPRLVENSAERVTGFPTQLPLALIRPLVQGLSNPGDRVLDPFNGSGTTGHAAIECGRHYLGIDKSEKFVALARERLSTVAVLPSLPAKEAK